MCVCVLLSNSHSVGLVKGGERVQKKKKRQIKKSREFSVKCRNYKTVFLQINSEKNGVKAISQKSIAAEGKLLTA